MAAAEELEGRVPGMPAPVMEEEPVQATEAAAVALQPAAAAPEQLATNAVPVQVALVEPVVPFEARHQEISGYEATMKFLEGYQANPDESLFLFFMCSDEQFKANDWSEECVEGKKHVYDVFSKSPAATDL